MTQTQKQILGELHRSLDERWRPESIAQKFSDFLTFDDAEARIVKKALKGADRKWAMAEDFARPKDMTDQLATAMELFNATVGFDADDVDEIDNWISEQGKASLHKTYGASDFKADRLDGPARKAQGMTMSRRRYNKLFRMAVRLEEKSAKLRREQLKRTFALASKTRLGSSLDLDNFASDPTTACFVAYYSARCNLRSVFTNATQVRAYDEICELLMARCEKSPTTNWWAIAQVLPNAEVVRHLDDEQKGVLLGDYFELMVKAAKMLQEIYDAGKIGKNMVVQKGCDSTTWNQTAGAWNKLRQGWFTLVYELGLTAAVDAMCPGKVLRLIAADVAAWHKSSGGDTHQDTKIWSELPLPWEVIAGTVACPKSLVEAVCEKRSVDPVKSGWSAPSPVRVVETFTPTPQLVHGVVVSSPFLAAALRKAGVFAGPSKAKGKKMVDGDLAVVADEIRTRHRKEQTQRRHTQAANKKVDA